MANVVAVLTADIVGSTAYTDVDRKKVDKIIRHAFKDATRQFPDAFKSELDFRITAGDEFQVVIADIPDCFQILTYIRAVVAGANVEPLLRFRASIGIGSAVISSRANPYENDGEAFVRSRRGLDEIAADRTPELWTKIRTGRQHQDIAFDAMLSALDFMQQSWTARQWEAVRWSLVGANRLDSAKRLKIRHQNVSKRLKGAGWAYFKLAADGIKLMLGTDSKMQPQIAS